jgi:hypothetical protein
MGLKAVVEHYKRVHRPNGKVEVAWFKSQPDLATAVDTAATATNSQGKRYAHQCRIKKVAMRKALAALRGAVAKIEKAGDFDELYDTVNAAVGAIDGIGDLYVYDAAFGIGAFLGLVPRRVYLHAGTRAGARRLGLTTGCRPHGEAKEVEAEASEFAELSPAEMEDVLCIYKDPGSEGRHGRLRAARDELLLLTTSHGQPERHG